MRTFQYLRNVMSKDYEMRERAQQRKRNAGTLRAVTRNGLATKYMIPL